MDKAILYSINCPRCNVLKDKLDGQDVDYVIATDVKVIREKGITQLPMLEVGGALMNFSEALMWLQGSGLK